MLRRCCVAQPITHASTSLFVSSTTRTSASNLVRQLAWNRNLSDQRQRNGQPSDKEWEKLSENLKRSINLGEQLRDAEKAMPKTTAADYQREKQREARERHERGRIFTWKVVAGIGVVIGTTLTALLYLRKQRLDEREAHRRQVAGKARIGGEWQLVNMDGKPEGSLELRGNWLLIYFGFTHCPDICPDEIEKMVKVTNILAADPNSPLDIVPIVISVDPERDTPARLKKYCAEFSPKLRGFTGTKEQTEAVSRTFRVYHSQGPRSDRDKSDYIVDHTVIMYLIDPDGEFHDYYGQNRTAEQIADVIRLKVLKKQLNDRKGFLSSLIGV